MTAITSESARFQLLEALRHNRRKRTQQARFLIEGVRPIDRAVAAGWPVEAVLRPAGATPSRWARSVLDALAGAEQLEVRPDLFERLADRNDTPELVLVGVIAEPPLAALAPPADGIVVVVDRPARPGNLGTILRTSDALGAAAVLTVGHGAHLYDPRTVRASVGSLFALPALSVPGPTELAGWLERWRRSAPVTVFATDEDGPVSLEELGEEGRPRRPALLLLGTERTGLARGLRDLADVTLRIPMSGSASSLNIAVAHGIVLHALAR